MRKKAILKMELKEKNNNDTEMKHKILSDLTK